MLEEHVGPDMNLVVGADAEDVHVVRRVVDLAESESVRNLGESALVTVLKNVRGVEEVIMSEPADRAARAVRMNDELSESVLMESTFGESYCQKVWN
jgi:hypothetical protein